MSKLSIKIDNQISDIKDEVDRVRAYYDSADLRDSHSEYVEKKLGLALHNLGLVSKFIEE